MITLMPLPRIVSRSDIECPGDTIPYRCTVQSNSEMVELRWLVTFPGQDTITMFLYTNDSERNVAMYMPMNLTARLIQPGDDENLASEIELTVLQNVSMNGTLLECKSEDLASENETVYVNTAGKILPRNLAIYHIDGFTYTVPLIPSGFNITEEDFTVEDLTVTFEWDEPQGSGPEAIVDNYTVVITPMPLYPFGINVLPNFLLALNVTLDYNTSYMATITAENCAGMSETYVYPLMIEYGEYYKVLCR